MARRKILWLCSWYPNRLDAFDGDFIQRHARSAALYHDVHVIRVTGDEQGTVTSLYHEEINKTEGLTEQIVYYKRSNSVFAKLVNAYRWIHSYRKAVRKYMVQNGKPCVAHVHIPMNAGLTALWFRRFYKVPYIVSEHWGIYNNVVEDNFATRSNFFKRATRRIFNKASLFLSVSRYAGEGVNKMVTQKSYEIIHNVTDTDIFFPSVNKSPVFRFIHVSGMMPLKNVKGILEAVDLLMKKRMDFEIVFIGNRNENILNEVKSKEALNKTIFFRGEISYTEVAKEMQQAHCLVLFSDIENSPCVIGEAHCCGLPVIAARTGGIPELITEENGMLVTPRDINELAEKMNSMIEHYSQYNTEQIAGTAKQRFSMPVIGKKFDKVYREFCPE